MRTTTQVSLSEVENFSVEEFQRRWKLARMSAILESLEECQPSGFNREDEWNLIKSVSEQEHELLLRRVFDNSRKLGLSAVRHFGITLDSEEICSILESSGSPCVRGRWRAYRGDLEESDNDARVLKRTACGSSEAPSKVHCDYWREAVDGLVMGVGDVERFARHSSLGNGDPECLDVIYLEEPRKNDHRIRWGKIPSEVSAKLKPLLERFERMKVSLCLDGYSESILYYHLDVEEGVLCGAGGKLLHGSVQKEVLAVLPGMKVQDTGPLAVYGGSES